jgi:ER lumen protein retaining receptor
MLGMLMSGRLGATLTESKGKAVQNKAKEFFFVYLVFFSCCIIAYQSHRTIGCSTLITLTVALQFLAYSLLAVKVIQQQSVSGVSAKALQCHAVVYIARLSSTTWLKGYLPMDGTGSWLYQLIDAMSLAMVLVLLYHVFRRYRATYSAEQDDFEIGYLLGVCLILAVVFHPNLNRRPFFDVMWTFALYVDMVAMMPQLWVITKLGVGAKIELLNGHYIMAIAASRAVSLYFWVYGFVEFAPKDGSFNFTGWAIMGAHIIQMLLLLDFMYYYVKACIIGSMRAVTTGDYSQGLMQVKVEELYSQPGLTELA